MADAPKITAFLKPVCGWSAGVREVFAKYDLAYEDRDIINNPENYAEMVQKSGQPLRAKGCGRGHARAGAPAQT